MASRAVTAAFADRPDIIQGVQSIIDNLPQSATTLERIANYVLNLKSSSTNGSNGIAASQQDTKKRKIDEANGAASTEIAVVGGDGGKAAFTIPDISFSVPVRKKLKLEGYKNGIRAVDAQGNAEVKMSWDSIDHVFCLPVPDRAKPQFNFVAVPRSTSSTVEAAVWTAPEPNPKLDTPQESHRTMTEKLEALLTRYQKSVEVPREEDFAGKSGPKDSKNYGVRAHKGTKEGHLFFLQPGILFAFKKPLIFIPFHAITSVSYTSVLQRTFNLNIVGREGSGDVETETEIEFAMIDQESYAGIDEYIKKHGLNDASLADARRAKVYGVNAKKGAVAAGQEAAQDSNGVAQDGAGAGADDEEDDGMTELQRAEKLLQDQEDEEEEDYVDGDDDDDGSSDGEEYEEGEGEVQAEDAREDAEEVEAEYEEEAGGYEGEDPMHDV